MVRCVEGFLIRKGPCGTCSRQYPAQLGQCWSPPRSRRVAGGDCVELLGELTGNDYSEKIRRKEEKKGGEGLKG